MPPPRARCSGATHAALGGHLLSFWGFHDPLVTAAAYRHRPERASTREVNALTTLHVAQAISSFDWPDAKSRENLLGRMNKEYLAEVGVTEHLPLWLDMVVAKRDEAAAAELQRALVAGQSASTAMMINRNSM